MLYDEEEYEQDTGSIQCLINVDSEFIPKWRLFDFLDNEMIISKTNKLNYVAVIKFIPQKLHERCISLITAI